MTTNGEARGARTPRASEAETEDTHSILREPRHVKGCDEDCAHCNDECLGRRVHRSTLPAGCDSLYRRTTIPRCKRCEFIYPKAMLVRDVCRMCRARDVLDDRDAREAVKLEAKAAEIISEAEIAEII